MSISSSALSLLLAATHPASAQEPARDPGSLTMLAEIALEQGDCKLASESYEVAMREGDVSLARRASEVALACEHLPAAWASAQRWRALAPEDVNAAALYATVALKLYRLAEAREAVVTLVRAQAGDANAEVKLAQFVSGLLEEAEAPAVLAAVGDAVDPATASAGTLALMAGLAFDAYDIHRAERYAQQALKRDPQSFDARRILAQIYATRRDSVNAIAAARAVAEADPKRGRFEVFEAFVALDRLDEARAELERLRAQGAPAEEIDRRLGVLAFENGDLEEAERRFTALSALPEGGENTAFYLAQIAERNGNVDGALAGYRDLVNSSLAVTARTRAASLLMARGSRAEALTMLDSDVNEHPERSFEMTMVKAQLLADHGEIDSGIALLGAALGQHPQHPALLYSRAVLFERNGQVAEAIEQMEQLLGARGEDPTLLNATGYTLAEHGLRLAHAERLIRRALAIVPDNPAVIDSLGWVRFRRGDVKGAIVLLDRAYTLGRDAEIAAHLGEALWKRGAHVRAREVWAGALAREPHSAPLEAVIGRFMPVGKP